MEKPKTMKDVRKLSVGCTETLSSGIRVIGYITLLKLLYKQKIKPSTAILLIATYNLNNKKANDDIYNSFRRAFQQAFDVKEQETPKKIDTMGFSIN